MNPAPSNNAKSVIEAWADKGNVRAAWGPAAEGRAPSELQLQSAEAFGQVARTADHQADLLQRQGFLSSHPHIKSLREMASIAARRNQDLVAWSADLRLAEIALAPMGVSEGTPDTPAAPRVLGEEQ